MGWILDHLLVMLALSAAQVLLGVGLGWWLRARCGDGGVLQGDEARDFIARLHQVANNVADDVDQHAFRMEQISKALSVPPRPAAVDSGASELVAVVSQIVHANQHLQGKLAAAEELIQSQASKLDLHLAEARRDLLTELPNRRAFFDELSRRFAEWQRTQVPFSLMMIDLDRFQPLNATYGPQAGDHVLRSVAEILTATLREMDLVARYGGEEFAVILPSTNLADAACASQRVRQAVQRMACRLGDQDVHVTVSTGVAQILDEENPRALLRRTMLAIDSAKEAGRNCGWLHDGEMCEPASPERLATHAARQIASPAVPATATPAQRTAASAVDARTDVLTGLPNRRAFSDELRRQVAECRGQGQDLSLLLVGLDRLGTLADLQGPQIVDLVVREVSAVLAEAVRDEDLVTRYGWEKFAIILPATAADGGRLVEQRIHKTLAERSLPVACSDDVMIHSGLVTLEPEEDTVSFAKRADAALGAAQSKSDGGTRLGSADLGPMASLVPLLKPAVR